MTAGFTSSVQGSLIQAALARDPKNLVPEFEKNFVISKGGDSCGTTISASANNPSGDSNRVDFKRGSKHLTITDRMPQTGIPNSLRPKLKPESKVYLLTTPDDIKAKVVLFGTTMDSHPEGHLFHAAPSAPSGKAQKTENFDQLNPDKSGFYSLKAGIAYYLAVNPVDFSNQGVPSQKQDVKFSAILIAGDDSSITQDAKGTFIGEDDVVRFDKKKYKYEIEIGDKDPRDNKAIMKGAQSLTNIFGSKHNNGIYNPAIAPYFNQSENSISFWYTGGDNMHLRTQEKDPKTLKPFSQMLTIKKDQGIEDKNGIGQLLRQDPHVFNLTVKSPRLSKWMDMAK